MMKLFGPAVHLSTCQAVPSLVMRFYKLHEVAALPGNVVLFDTQSLFSKECGIDTFQYDPFGANFLSGF